MTDPDTAVPLPYRVAAGLVLAVPCAIASVVLDVRRAMTERITTDWDELPSLRVERAA